MSNNAVVDLSTLEEYTDGDQEALRELIEVFYETAEEALEILEKNVVDGENESWSAAGHKLKGASGYVGAEKLRSLCAQAQDMKVASRDERDAMFKRIQQQYVAVREVLEGK